MKILVISDLHYEREVRKGIDESKAWEWLLSVVDYHKPDLLLSCGDWGTAVNNEELYKLLRRVIVLTIYGNHENLDVLRILYNIKANEYLPVLMEDGKIYEIGSLKIAGINGIIASRRVIRKGVPRKVATDFIKVARRLRGKNIDVLLIHEVPALKEVYSDIRVDDATLAVLKSIKIIRPCIVFNGHLHRSPYTIYRFNDISSVYIRIDSSQAHRHYAVFYPSKSRIEIWYDCKIVESIGDLLSSDHC